MNVEIYTPATHSILPSGAVFTVADIDAAVAAAEARGAAKSIDARLMAHEWVRIAVRDTIERCAKVCEQTEVIGYPNRINDGDDAQTTLASAARRIREGVEPK